MSTQGSTFVGLLLQKVTTPSLCWGPGLTGCRLAASQKGRSYVFPPVPGKRGNFSPQEASRQACCVNERTISASSCTSRYFLESSKLPHRPTHHSLAFTA